MWIKAEIISVPAHKSQTTEVSVNEWFIQNHSFLLGTPVASQLRGTDGSTHIGGTEVTIDLVILQKLQ